MDKVDLSSARKLMSSIGKKQPAQQQVMEVPKRTQANEIPVQNVVSMQQTYTPVYEKVEPEPSPSPEEVQGMDDIISGLLKSFTEETDAGKTEEVITPILDREKQAKKLDLSKIKSDTEYRLAYVPKNILSAIGDIVEAVIEDEFTINNTNYGIINLDIGKKQE